MKKTLAGLTLSLLLVPQFASAVLNDAISYWAFDESSGNPVDSSGNSKTLTNNNTATFVAAKVSNGADLEFASQQSFTRSNGAYYDVTSATINCWIKPETIDVTPGNVALVSSVTNVGAGGFHFQLRPHNSDTINLYFGAGNQSADGATTLSPGTWYMVTATWSTLRKEVFVNATTDGANETDETMTAGPTDLAVGKYSQSAAQWYDGILDECGIWSRVLSGSEITELYNSGSGTNPYAASPSVAPKVQDIIIISRGDWVWNNGIRGPIPPRFISPLNWNV